MACECSLYVETLKAAAPHITDLEIDQMIGLEFATWFREHVRYILISFTHSILLIYIESLQMVMK